MSETAKTHTNPTEIAAGTILIVDDQPENLAVLSAVLQAHYRVRAARSGEQALRVAHSDPKPDLVLLDIMMPEMDGYTVLSKLRNDPATQSIPVIFVTALGAEAEELKGLELGAVDYITKPIKPSLVLARVSAHLELKAARDALANQNALLETKVAERTLALKQAMDKLELANSSLKKAYFGTLLAISEFAELRGGGIGEHSRRVAELSRLVALHMGMDANEVQDVFVAALLHDVGKISFSDDLLEKSVSAMNRDELAIYRRHPGRGADSIRKIETLAGIAEMIRHHHERYDGSGFPDQLSGLNIPLGARIIGAVSDYVSLKNGELTDQAMSPKESCQFLLEEQGSRYDPLVIEKLEPILASEENFEIEEVPITAPHLHEGMTLTRDVHHPNGFVLLSKDTVMTRRLIDQLVAIEQQTNARVKIFVQREQKRA
jgi:response regulator RpfG family c-di-GMP phosphodiesterase